VSDGTGRRDFTIKQGATFRVPMTWKQGLTKETATPIDISDYIARMQVREKVQSSQAVLTLSTDTGHITLGGELGTIEIVISDEETELLEFDGPAFYDLELESGGGEVRRLLQGRIGLSREVTREDEP
jgi:hypothetical protein